MIVMPQFIVEIRNPADDSDRRLLFWSTIVDAPVSYGVTEAELTEHVCVEDGESGLRALPDRLARVRKTGTSSLDGTTWREMLAGNRAGEGETELSTAEIWQQYAYPPLKCDCGASPSSDESSDTGTYTENGKLLYICYACWCDANYGKGTVEALEAKRHNKRTR